MPNEFIQTARCYSLAFRGNPWNKAYLDQEGNFRGSEFDCTWRRLGFRRAYPLVDTTAHITKELQKPGATSVSISDPNNPKLVLAFGWGFSYDYIPELVLDKWPSANINQKAELYMLIKGVIPQGGLWYLSEVGVLPDNQNRGLGTKIVNNLIEAAPKSPIIMRTNANSPMTVIAAKAGFSQIMGPRTTRNPDSGKISIGPEVINMLDSINPDRILYYLSKE